MVVPEKDKIVTLAVITLHNWQRKESKNGKIYIPKSLISYENIKNDEVFEGCSRANDVEGSWYLM